MESQIQTSPSLELSDQSHFIGGERVAPASGEWYEDIDPARGRVICKVARGGKEDVDRAVSAAWAAFPEWRETPPRKREKVLRKLAELIKKNFEELLRLEVLDTGKPLWEAKVADLPGAITTFEYFAGWPTKIYGEVNPTDPSLLSYTVREPWGVVGCIVPWNFPLQMAAWKVAPALAAGNCVVLKPAEETPLSALRLAELAVEAGLPPGVLNVVTGFGEEAGAALVAHPGVRKIAFTGSSETGKIIMRQAAEHLVPVSLELGGKSPNIILADANLKLAVRFALAGIFWNQGQLCTAGSRLVVEEAVYDQVVELVKEGAERLEPGDPMDENTRLGALISQAQFERVMGYIEKGKSEGAKLLVGGEPHPLREELGGYFVRPTVFVEVDNARHTIAREEIFGPVLSVIKVKDFDEAIKVANDTFYGLAAAVWTRDITKAHRAARELEAGTVWINTYNAYDVSVPFGGFKGSGFGREQGRYAIELYTQPKSVYVNLK